MKILVIDDKQSNLDAAKLQLSNHEVTTASSYDEAEKYLAGSLPHVSANGRWENVGWDKDYKLNKYEFDVILTDLFMPASKRGVGSNPSTEEVPYGVIISMVALRLGIPVAIVTTGSHHSNPFMWALDMIGLGYNGGSTHFIGDTPFTCANVSESRMTPEGASSTKDWGVALDKLLSVK